MGMTNGQFKGYIRLVIRDLKEIRLEAEKEINDPKNSKTLEDIEKLIEDIQTTLED